MHEYQQTQAINTPLACKLTRPVEFTPDVLAAAGGLPMSHMDLSFAMQFGETIEMLRKVPDLTFVLTAL